MLEDIALTLHPKVSPRTVVRLLECFGSAEAIYGASEEQLRSEASLMAAPARSIARRETHARARAELEFVSRNRLRAIASTDPDYPQRLRECEDFPHVIYVSGALDLNAGRWLSVVGTRNITPYGQQMCQTLIAELAALVPDLVIVSGLAYGVDVAAHRAALRLEIPTVGVLGHPIDRIYPQPHTATARQMVSRGGAVLTEFPSGTEPRQAGFVQRNRVIAGLSEGTLVVESAARGGSLITAEMADGYHRTLMAVPGRVGDAASEGTNRLIRTLRAQMVCSGQEIAEALGWKPEAASTRAVQGALFDRTESAGERPAAFPPPPGEIPPGDGSLSPEAVRLLSLIGTQEPVHLDELSGKSAESPEKLSLLLLELELEGKIAALPGSRYLKY